MPPRKKAETLPARADARGLLDFINQQLGPGTVMMASDPSLKLEFLPTGIAPIDHLLKGGIPYGRFVVFHGDYSTLKSYVGLCAIAQAQNSGKIAALIDTEHAFDPAWAKKIGINLDELIFRQPETGEKALDLAESLIRGGVDLIVFDSVAAALPQAEQVKSMEDPGQLARQAAMMSKAMRKLTAPNKKTAVIWINQTRVNVNVMFGNPESVPGGKALPYYASYIIGLYRAGKVTEDIDVHLTGPDGKPVKKKYKQTVGQQIRAVVAKSKLNAPFREITFTFSLRKGGVDDWDYLVNIALDAGLIGYDRGRWWLTDRPDQKKTHAEFRGFLPLEDLKAMMVGMVEGIEFAGVAPHASKPVEKPKLRSSNSTALKPTRTAARGKSPSTAVRLKRSSK